ncbi:MAG: stage II sporulation protein M [archaeon]
MVLDFIINPKKATGNPWEMYFIGALYSLFAVILSYWIFNTQASLVVVALTAMACVPFIHKAITSEENKDVVMKKFNEFKILKEHYKLINVFVFLFLGFVTVFTVLYVVLPSSVIEKLFSSQIDTIIHIHTMATGKFYASFETMGQIIFNNLKVMLFCLIFSFFYGVGAIFIITWNASVMGVALGSAIRHGISLGTNIAQVISINLVGYFVHGIPEIVAYFLVGLSGGILSAALHKEKFMSKKFKRVMLDSGSLFVLAIFIIILAAAIEVFISPRLLFGF